MIVWLVGNIELCNVIYSLNDGKALKKLRPNKSHHLDNFIFPKPIN